MICHCRYWFICVIFDLFDLIRYLRNLKYYRNCDRTIKGKKATLNRSVWYNVAGVLSVHIISMSASFHDMPGLVALDVARVIAILSLVWAILYFVQLRSNMGYFVASIQSMMHDFMNFMIIFAIILIPFSQMLLVFVNTNSKQGCIEEFSSLGKSTNTVLMTEKIIFFLDLH